MTAATARAGGRARGLVRAGAAPVACGLVLVAVLGSWVAAGGGGTIARVRVQVTLAAIPMPSFTEAGAPALTSATYLTIRNLSASPDVLLSASSPAAVRVVLVRGPGAAARGGLSLPAAGTLTLSPFGPDLVLTGPRQLEAGEQVPLILRFRHAGTVTVEASVTPPGTP
jgi:copper(I)-binding protein